MGWKTRQSTITPIVLANISVQQCQARSLQPLSPTSIWRKVAMQPVPVLQTYVASFEEPCLADSNTSTHQVVGNIEWLGLEGTPRIIKFQSSATGRATNLQICYPGSIQPGLEHPQGWVTIVLFYVQRNQGQRKPNSIRN